jgi:TetR/AcrR family transcriptional regulator, mexCD-oprJ operon repressor
MGTPHSAEKLGRAAAADPIPEPLLRDRTRRSDELTPRARAILDSVARVFADRGSAVSMTEIAARAGVGRATLYRYFPTREVLMRELQRVAVEDVGHDLRAANLEAPDAPAALDRAVRVVLAVGHHYAVVVREQVPVSRKVADELVRDPIRGMLARAQSDGLLRAECTPEWLEDMFVGLVNAGLEQIVRRGADEDATARTVVAAYLDGAGVRRG